MTAGSRFAQIVRALAVGLLLVAAAATVGAAQAQAPAPARKPNILVIMGDDIGWFNIGAYHRGIMSGKTPNLDKLASEGMMFTDYYAEASCTAGRANFITGELPLRTGLTTVGQAGADVGLPDEAVTIATVLKSLGYETGQFGKNHLGDLNKFLPTVHGFDEFFGYLYHLDAMSDPYWFDYPQDWIDKYGPRDLIHSYATDVDDPTVQPRWGKIGKQRIVDEGPLAPFPDMAGRQNWQEGRKALRHGDVRQCPGAGQLGIHGQGEAGRQTVLPLAQHDAHARVHLHPAQVPGEDELPEQLRPGRGRHGADG
jgi:Sulfatase